MKHLSGAHDFDFYLHTWTVLNRRKKMHSLVDTPQENQDAVWEEFPGIAGMGTKHLDGRVMIDHYESTFPNGQQVKGLNIRTFDDESNIWSLVWLDNRNPADFTPLVGSFEQGVGTFYQVLTSSDGKPFHVRFLTTNCTAETAHWEQAFSFDAGSTWETNWTMDFTRQAEPTHQTR